MNHADAKVRCPECDAWVPVDREDERTRCDCGTMYVVTVSAIGSPSAEATAAEFDR